MDPPSSKQTESKKPHASPYLASLSDVDLRKGVRSNTSFHAASVAAKLPGAGRTVLAFIEEGLKNKDSNSRLVVGKPPKHINPVKPFSKRPSSKQSRQDIGTGSGGTPTMKSSKTQKLFVTNGFGDKASKPAERSKSVSEVVSKATPKSLNRPSSSLVNLNGTKPDPASTTTEPAMSRVPAFVTDEDFVEMAPPIKALKSILKITSLEKTATGKPSKSSSRPSGMARTNPMRAVWNKIGGDFTTASSRSSSKDRHDKRVKFFEKVEIHPVPYEARGSTEWQHNLMLSREHILRSLFSVPMGGYMQNSCQMSTMGGWGSGLGGPPMDSWSCVPPAPTRSLRRQRKPF